MANSDNVSNDVFLRLSTSKFRSSFKLKDSDKCYIVIQGMPIIRQHAHDFINSRLAPEIIANDGKQTPFKGHPVFIAQHATATCCRNCVQKWHNIPKSKPLSQKEKDFCVELITKWIDNQMQL